MLKVIKCPSCAAPLECDGDLYEKCDFCGSQVAVTQNNSVAENTVGFDGLLKNAHKLKEILLLARNGNKIQAIKIYRETFGSSLVEAKDAVERLENGQSVSFQNVQFQTLTPIKINPETTKTALKAVGFFSGSMLLISAVIGVFVVAIVGIVLWMTFSRIDSATRNLPFGSKPEQTEYTKNSFAREILRFGGEGNGAGKFTDNRTIAVDGKGNIYSADYQGGRVQVFDKDGKFLTQWFVKDKDSAIYSVAANRQGKVFVTQPGGKIMAYEGVSGKLLTETKLDIYSTIYITLDGKIVAATRTDILVVDENLKVINTFKNAAQNAGFKDGFNYLAVSGSGDIFAGNGSGKDLARFSSDGKFVDRFKIQPTTIQDMAIDPKGRIYIAETNKIWVYQSDGNLIDSIDTKQTFAIILNDEGELLTASRPFVVKYETK